MENLRQIFTVPESIDEIRAQLKARSYFKYNSCEKMKKNLYLNGVFCLVIILTFQKAGELLQAHKTLRELEMSRDELLYEQHKLENGSQGLG